MLGVYRSSLWQGGNGDCPDVAPDEGKANPLLTLQLSKTNA